MNRSFLPKMKRAWEAIALGVKRGLDAAAGRGVKRELVPVPVLRREGHGPKRSEMVAMRWQGSGAELGSTMAELAPAGLAARRQGDDAGARWGAAGRRGAGLLALVLLLGAGAKAQGPHFSHQTIFVTDLDRAANFYEKVMELKRIEEPFHDGKHVWFRIGEHAQLHVVSGAKEDGPHDINIHLAFSVANMAAFTKHLDEMHVKYGNWAQNSTTPQVRPDKVLQIYLQDPDGYWLEVNDDKF